MTTWNYILGNEKDFEGAPDWALYLHAVIECDGLLKAWSNDSQYQYVNGFSGIESCTTVFNGEFWDYWGKAVALIAQRESVADAAPIATNDNINHPLRYTKGDIECIDAIKAATVGKTGIEAVCVANVIKYLWRYEEKNGLEDVKKARWYLERLISELENNK